MKNPWVRTRRLRLASLAALTAVLLLGFVLTPAADHRDGPLFGPPGVNGAGGIATSRRDMNDIYVFRSPTNPNNTCLILNIAPFTTANLPAVFDHRLTIDFNIINSDLINASDDVKLRVTFTAPDSSGAQQVVLRGLPAEKFTPPTLVNPNPSPILAQGRTGQNLPIKVGGQFRAAEQDDPFFFDAVGFARLINNQANALPRPVGQALNFFGPDVNTLSMMIEIPSRFLTRPGSNLIGVWTSITFKGTRIDRMGRPGINTAVIPPLPRGSNFPVDNTIPNRRERRNAFNAGHPKNDRRDFKADVVAVLQNFYGRNATDANNIANLLLPDILIFDVTSTAGFGTFLSGGTLLGNGRRLRDDVIDFELNVLTNGAITTDNVNDDNPGAVNAGPASPIQAGFPYIGARNANPSGLPREGLPAPGQ